MNIHQKKIYNYILNGIIEGKFSYNTRIPVEKDLGEMFNTNRLNAYYAVKKLEELGVVWRNKRQGTFVKKVPSSLSVGELKSVLTRRVCVLCHVIPKYSRIHWNERIITPLEENLRLRNIDIVFKRISDIKNRKEFLNYMEDVAKEGYNSILLITDTFVDSLMMKNPDVLFRFHNNVCIYDRGMSTHYWPYNTVAVNPFREGILVTEYLMSQKYKKIIYVISNKFSNWQDKRYQGMKAALKREPGSTISLEKFEYANWKELPKVFDLLKDTDCALVIRNDEVAAMVYDHATEAGLKPGLNFGLIGFDNDPKFVSYNLTTVSQPLEKIGKRLAELLADNIDGKTRDEVINIQINSELIIRETC